MEHYGPELEQLLHRLADCPAEFLLGPDNIDIAALACDHFRALGTVIPSPSERRKLSALPQEMRGILPIVLWLMRDPWFLARPQLADATWKLLLSDSLNELAKRVRPDVLTGDPDRREELVRVCLSRLNLVPFGESAAQAADRLGTLDSVERERVIRQTRHAEARARQIREAMARKRAEEAAARYSPE